jgi:hypothetical protein
MGKQRWVIGSMLPHNFNHRCCSSMMGSLLPLMIIIDQNE